MIKNIAAMIKYSTQHSTAIKNNSWEKLASQQLCDNKSDAEDKRVFTKQDSSRWDSLEISYGQQININM